MEITKEQAKADLDKVVSQFGTLETENGWAEQMVLRTIGVLERRLGHPQVVKKLYVDDPKLAKHLPSAVYEVAQAYVSGTIDEKEARERLSDAYDQYIKIFQETGWPPK